MERARPAPVVWFEIRVTDLARAESFYGALLGWTFRPFEGYDPERYHLISTGEGRLGGGLVLVEPAPVRSSLLGIVLYAEVPDLDPVLALAVSLGGAVMEPPAVVGPADGWFAVVTDPDGNRVGLWSDREPTGSR